MRPETESPECHWPACVADEATYAAAVTRDAERRRRADAAARFGRRLAHDTNNFLTIIRTYSELIAMEAPPESGIASDVVEVMRAAEGLSEYLQAAVKFGRVESAHRKEIDVTQIAADVVRQALLEERGPIVLEADQACRATADAAWLTDLLRGLIENAREAAGTGSLVRVRVARAMIASPSALGDVPVAPGEWVVCDVQDQGGGIDERVATHLGEPFTSTHENVRGAGGTLAAVCAFAWRAGGQFALVRLGEATHARLFLPARD